MSRPHSFEAGRVARALSRRPLVRRIRHLAVAPRTSDGIMLGLAAGVGLATGLLAVALIQFVGLVQRVAFGSAPGPLTIVAVTTLGGLLVGLLITYGMPELRGGGVTEVMEAIAVHGGRMRGMIVPGKLVASGLSLGTGASGGREGPIVQIGGAVGSLLGRVFALSEEQKRVLIAAGAAAGISASFNAPIGGMLFAIEVIIGGFRLRYLQVIVISSVAASVTAREILGEALIYDPPPYELGAPAELVLFALVGLGAVLVGLALARGEHLAVRLADGLAVWPPLRTAAGGLVVGLVALLLPEVLGTGDDLPPVPGAVTEPIAAMLSGEFAPQYGLAGLAAAGLLVALLVAKLVTTCASIGTGAAVGSFSPAIFLGAALGGSIGHAATVVLPDAGIRPGALALVGMAAVLGASSRAPLTGVLIAFELTGSYGLVLPLMLATGIATLVSDRLDSRSIYTLPLHERGIPYGEPEDVDVLQTVRVGEVMTRNPRRLDVDAPLAELEQALDETGQHGFPVVRQGGDGERLVGVVSLSDLEQASAGERPAGADPDRLTVGDICSRTPVTVTPADPVFRAVRRMASLDVGRLPVVSEEDHGRLVGWLRRADIVRAYQRALHRSLGVQERQAGSRLRQLSGTQFVEATVMRDAPACGRTVREIEWPPRTLLTSIRRAGELVTPNGSTLLEAEDDVLALVDSDHVQELRNLLTGKG
jgi:CIC family chloride channel protein